MIADIEIERPQASQEIAKANRPTAEPMTNDPKPLNSMTDKDVGSFRSFAVVSAIRGHEWTCFLAGTIHVLTNAAQSRRVGSGSSTFVAWSHDVFLVSRFSFLVSCMCAKILV